MPLFLSFLSLQISFSTGVFYPFPLKTLRSFHCLSKGGFLAAITKPFSKIFSRPPCGAGRVIVPLRGTGLFFRL